MSTTIPYDPSLVLGNIVPDGHLSVLKDIADLQTPIDSAQDELNSAILLASQLFIYSFVIILLTIIFFYFYHSSINSSKETLCC